MPPSKSQRLFSIAVSCSLACSFSYLPLANASAISPLSTNDQSFAPSGTLLLPLTPKLDVSSSKEQPAKIDSSDSSKSQVDANAPVEPNNKSIGDSEELLPSLEGHSAENGKVEESKDDDLENIDETKLLKGTVQIVADDTEFDQDKNTFLGTGNAVALIGGQNSKLEADSILYDQNTQLINARGNVRILRNGQLTTGSAFKFKVTSDEYLITSPNTELQGSEIIARRGYGNKDGLGFKDGTMSIPSPFFFAKNFNNGPLSYREDFYAKRSHPDAYLPSHQSYKFKARKMVYERYKEQGNLTIFGGSVEVGNFSIPLGKFVCTVGQHDTRAVFPILPYIGNNLQMGGINVGPQFNTAIGRTGVISWSPLIQFGGRNLANGGSNTNSVGIGGQAAYNSDRVMAHIAYGSVSNLLVADLKVKLTRSIRFQSGINRFLNDGMFGNTRARLAAEVYDNHQYIDPLPGIGSVNFRTSGGWYQDNPQLVNINSTYSKLYGNPTKTVMNSAFKLQEQFTATTEPLFNIGDKKYSVKSFIYGGVAARGYSTGQSSLVGQVGPILDVHMDRLRFMTGYTESDASGSSPFVFDQFIQGSQSAFVNGDVRVNKYLTLGGLYGYNFNAKLAYAEQVQLAIGPPDFKLLVARDWVTNNYKVGFDMLYGQPIPFNKLIMKGGPDQGQLGGI